MCPPPSVSAWSLRLTLLLLLSLVTAGPASAQWVAGNHEAVIVEGGPDKVVLNGTAFASASAGGIGSSFAEASGICRRNSSWSARVLAEARREYMAVGNPAALTVELRRGTIGARVQTGDGRPLPPEGVPPDPGSLATALAGVRLDPGADFMNLVELAYGSGAVIWQPPMDGNNVSYDDDYFGEPLADRTTEIMIDHVFTATLTGETGGSTSGDAGAYAAVFTEIQWSDPPRP